MKYFFIIMGMIIHHLRRIIYRSLTLYYRTLFKFYGNNFSFDPNGVYIFSTITVGHNVNLGHWTIISIKNHEKDNKGAVVTKYVPLYIIEGKLAKVIKYRFSDDEIKKHETILLTSTY